MLRVTRSRNDLPNVGLKNVKALCRSSGLAAGHQAEKTLANTRIRER
jgi:hypothetical protein